MAENSQNGANGSAEKKAKDDGMREVRILMLHGM